ncbi:MAG: ROK family transcriptional regulator [Actinobacteria bacterium]|nr:ROK family transcriptional regulator [Actinomycetota bacterium]
MKKSLKFTDIVDSSLQNKINISIIFDHLRKSKITSRAQIARDLGISKPTVSRIIDKLIEQKYVIETEKKITSGGKRPIQLMINPKKSYVIGIDLGKEKMMTAITNFNGDIVKKFKGISLSSKKDILKKIINEINKILKEIRENNKIEKLEIEAICIGVPARIEEDSGKIIDSPVYKDWKDLRLKNVLGREFNIPIYIENDVILSALGEKHYGEGRKHKDIVFLEVSKGIGAGIISDNNLFKGTQGIAGEIAYIFVKPDDFNSGVNEDSYLESSASIHSLRTRAIKEIRSGKKTIIMDIIKNDIDKIEPSFICEAAIKGDRIANKVITEIVNFLSFGIINLILIQNPQVIVLGGDICNLPGTERLFVEPIIERIKKAVPFKSPVIKLSSLGENVGIMGASRQAIEFLLMDMFPYKIEKRIDYK